MIVFNPEESGGGGHGGADGKELPEFWKEWIKTQPVEMRLQLAAYTAKQYLDGIDEGKRQAAKNVDMLRQWLNEDRITDPKKMVTNEELLKWLEK